MRLYQFDGLVEAINDRIGRAAPSGASDEAPAWEDEKLAEWGMRLGFVATGLVLFRTAAEVYIQGQPITYGWTVALAFSVWTLGMALMVVAALPHGRPRLVWLILASAIIVQLAYAYVTWLNYTPLTGTHTDNEMIAQYAVQALRHGENPYLWNFSDMLRVFRDRGLNYTPFLDGSIQNRVTYPAFPTELLLAFDLIGLGSVPFVSALFQLALLALLFIGAPSKIKPLILLPIFALKDFSTLPMTGVQDVVWSALLVGMVLVWDRRNWRAVLFGLAASFRQQPWFVAPFILIYLWKGYSPQRHREHRENRSKERKKEGDGTVILQDRRAAIPSTSSGQAPGRAYERPDASASEGTLYSPAPSTSWPPSTAAASSAASAQDAGHSAQDALQRWIEVVRFAGISGGIFLLTNLPFIVWDPASWAMGAFEPSYAAFNMYSHGLGTLSQYGLASLPREFYSLLQLAFLVMALVVYWRHTRAIGQAFWIFPGVFFWLYYRGLDNYWIYWIPPLLLAMSRFAMERGKGWNDLFARERWNRSLVFSLAGLIILQILAAGLLARDAPIVASYSTPLETFQYGQPLVNRIRVSVLNTSNAPIEPRFAVQHDPSVQAMPWTIESGPEKLGPGEAADYVITADGLPAKAFPASEGGQIVISDASGSYWQRAVLNVPAETSYKNPDLVGNPDFVLWPAGSKAPEKWTLDSPSGVTASAQMEEVDGRTSLMLLAESSSTSKSVGTATLEQQISFPDTLSVWVHPEASTGNTVSDGYALEFDDGEHKLWIVFSQDAPLPAMSSRDAAVRLFSPPNTWTRQTIHLKDLYTRLGWTLPPFTPRASDGVKYSARQVQLSLVVIAPPAAAPAFSEAMGLFGPIEEDTSAFSANALVQDALDHPDAYYASRGDEYLRERNFALAEASYQQAIAFNPNNADAYYGLGESRNGLGDYAGAEEAYAKSVELGGKGEKAVGSKQ